jgi:hypothetical protein
MIISQAQIQFASHHRYQERTQVQEQWATSEQNGAAPSVELASIDHTLTTGVRVPPPVTQRQSLNLMGPLDANSRLQMLIIAQLYKQITGAELQLLTPQQLPGASSATPVDLPANSGLAAAGPLVYERRTRYEETERLHFSTQGKVMTQDGREIAISASLSMSRSFAATSSLTLLGGNAVMTDPLVINFDGTGAQLDGARFAFDLDSDGTPEQIASLRPNSGYLALDRNGDGQINNGSELFGPMSNNGFAELAVYDEDGNGFIDEGDSIYNQLRIWQRHSDGSSSLLALGDKNIGAIYLGHALTPMQLKDSANNSLGEVVSSGFYLREDGTSGIIQQINLAV